MLEQQEIDLLKNGKQGVWNNVHPMVEFKTKSLIQLLAAIDLPFGAFMGYRSFEEQNQLYAQGRTTPGKIVTNAKGGQSWHQFGLAIDLVEDGDQTQTGIQWSWAKNMDYFRIGELANQVGLEWGGFWKAFKDYPHVQFTKGMDLTEANLIYEVHGIQGVWDEIDRR